MRARCGRVDLARPGVNDLPVGKDLAPAVTAPLLVARFGDAAGYLAVHEAEVVHGGFFIRGATLPAGTPLGDCTLRVEIPGLAPVDCTARLGGATPGMGVLILFDGPPAALLALAARLQSGSSLAPTAGGDGEAAAEEPQGPQSEAGLEALLDSLPVDESLVEIIELTEDEPPDPAAGPSTPASRAATATKTAAAIRARESLTLPEKLRLAASGDREVRFALLRDPNKQLHAMVLKNPRIGLDEVLWAAKLNSISPDALKLIAEHPEWSRNASIAAAVVRNPKTPVPVALKLVPRLQLADVRMLAKSQGRPQIVQAARKIVQAQR